MASARYRAAASVEGLVTRYDLGSHVLRNLTELINGDNLGTGHANFIPNGLTTQVAVSFSTLMQSRSGDRWEIQLIYILVVSRTLVLTFVQGAQDRFAIRLNSAPSPPPTPRPTAPPPPTPRPAPPPATNGAAHTAPQDAAPASERRLSRRNSALPHWIHGSGDSFTQIRESISCIYRSLSTDSSRSQREASAVFVDRKGLGGTVDDDGAEPAAGAGGIRASFSETERVVGELNETLNESYHAGDEVEALFKGRGQFHAGNVAGANPDGTYMVLFKDKSIDASVAPASMRSVRMPSTRSSSAGGGSDEDKDDNGAAGVASNVADRMLVSELGGFAIVQLLIQRSVRPSNNCRARNTEFVRQVTEMLALLTAVRLPVVPHVTSYTALQVEGLEQLLDELGEAVVVKVRGACACAPAAATTGC
jgi:hypothetical protein